MNTNPVDFFGDVHGHLATLERLMLRMGYGRDRFSWVPPDGRMAVFVGDLIDKGPDSLGTLETVRRMVENGRAKLILGNHEFNALKFHQINPDSGKTFRSHSPKNIRQHKKTLDQIRRDPHRWLDMLEWLTTQPVFLDGGQWRVVHACWAPEFLDLFRDRPMDVAMLRKICTEGSRYWEAAACLMTGPEIILPEGIKFKDLQGHERKEARTSWWLEPGALPSRNQLLMPANLNKDPGIQSYCSLQEKAFLSSYHPYDGGQPPLFFGHYALSEESHQPILGPNLACLDFNVARGGSLLAYRWTGEKVLTPENLHRQRPLPAGY